MDKWTRRTVKYMAGLFAVILVYAAVYDYGMTAFDGRPRTFLEALQVVVETFTTTGFGSDAQWESWQMQALIIVMDLTGVFLIFLALPTLVFPLFEEALSTAAPTSVDRVGHVVIAGYTPRGRALIRELDARDIPYVVVEPDRDRAADIYETDTTVVHGDPESVEVYGDRVNLGDARALVADVDDATNASIALTATQVCDTPVITFVEEPSQKEYHSLAGASEAFSPRQLVGESLATKVTSGVTSDLDDAIEIGDGFDVVELPVESGSELDGVSVAESGIRERTGANIVGAWFRGEFVSPPSPDAVVDEQTILLVAGQEEQLEGLKRLTRSEQRRRRRGHVVVAGLGIVGTTVERAIEDSDLGLPQVTVDRDPAKDADVTGDVTDAHVLREAGVGAAGTVILSLPNDTVTVFATLVVRELNPEIEIVARAESQESVRKLYRAGADYVLSLGTVSGRMLASTILDEEVITFDQQVELIRTGPGDLTGRTLGEADVRRKTGCTVVAVERDGALVSDLGPDFRLQRGDELVVAGTDDDIVTFSALVGDE
ncbi:potassium channel family protein [Halomarina oriensis]|uniref:TrkA family potassium uptake protein n=1 Tax=Halomarina oriensis TaxID=671145 RepID=A0A6B0GQM6_9EURY|nr:NAD-binding protein [Halomarina oriensis]MWG33968.1 TrkA family potassium uptake protein [Halomarina oriensis]